MPDKREIFGPLRIWIAPAMGLGLMTAGIAMAAGMGTIYAPLFAGVVAVMVLSFGKWWSGRSTR